MAGLWPVKPSHPRGVTPPWISSLLTMEITHDRSSTVFVVTLVIIIVATVLLVLRLISKWGVTRKTNADDYVIILAWVFAVGLSVAIMIGTQVGLGAPDSREQRPAQYSRNPMAWAWTWLKSEDSGHSLIPQKSRASGSSR